jgi:hypothetical protein
MDGGLRAAVWVSPPLYLRTDDFLSNRWGPPQASATFGHAAILAINPREIPQVASTSVTRFIFAAFIVYPFDKLLKSAFGDQLASTRILVVA